MGLLKTAARMADATRYTSRGSFRLLAISVHPAGKRSSLTLARKNATKGT